MKRYEIYHRYIVSETIRFGEIRVSNPSRWYYNAALEPDSE